MLRSTTVRVRQQPLNILGNTHLLNPDTILSLFKSNSIRTNALLSKQAAAYSTDPQTRLHPEQLHSSKYTETNSVQSRRENNRGTRKTIHATLGPKSGQNTSMSEINPINTSTKLAMEKAIENTNSGYKPQQTSYASNDVSIPETFLTGPAEKPITVTHVPFATSKVPEYDGLLAIVLDNVISPEECKKLLMLAVESAPLKEEGASAWQPALVNVGGGLEAALPDRRSNDRIVWDSQTIVDRLWDRCLQADGVKELLSKTPADRPELEGRWVFERVNERMRFLKYTPGQFFKAHNDGSYGYVEDGTEIRTHYTIHLYLNDSAKASATGEGHLGGATAFLSRDEKRQIDIDPKAGTVLIFQHKGLLHEGAEVVSGVKYTMRSDILYRWVNK